MIPDLVQPDPERQHLRLNDDGTTFKVRRQPLIVMPSNATGWLFHSMARETGRIGHLHSPGAQRGPYPWFPYALDNGAFSCWTPSTNTFDHDKWRVVEKAWERLLLWAQVAPVRPRWAIVPDVPGNAAATIERWSRYAPRVVDAGLTLAVAVQDGMCIDDVWDLRPEPEVVCVGGTTRWKWESAWLWCHDFDRVHVLRCNSPRMLPYLERIGAESTDGTGWNRGDRETTRGLEEWARGSPLEVNTSPLWPYTCRKERDDQDSLFV